MAAAETDGRIGELRRELARERERLAAAVGDLERSVALGSRLGAHRRAIVGGAFVTSFVLAGGLSALARAMLRRSRRERVLLAVGGLALVRRGR